MSLKYFILSKKGILTKFLKIEFQGFKKAFIHQQVYHIFIEQYTFYSDV